jgi:hypothetical protein
VARIGRAVDGPLEPTQRQPVVHRRLFYWGTTRFHREQFSAAWDEHHESVEHYFEGRDDVLVIDVAGAPEAELWEALSRFIGRPIPEAPFPHMNRSTK